MSKFIEVIGHGNRWALNIENIQRVKETQGGNALVFFGEDDCIELQESYDSKNLTEYLQQSCIVAYNF